MEEHEFKQKLTPEQYRVMREKGTETPHTGTYWKHDETGIYTCAACGSILFLSLNKVESEKGWPTFTKPASKSAVVLTKEGERTEVSCKKCASHAGYLVGGDKKLYEVNSIALGFQELPDIDWEMKDGDDQSKDSQQQNTSTAKTISLTIGGITIGAVVGAGAMWAATPPTMCTPTPAQLTQASSTLPTSTGGVNPAPTGGTKTPPASPAASSTPAQGSASATSSAATSSNSGGSAATTTP